VTLFLFLSSHFSITTKVAIVITTTTSTPRLLQSTNLLDLYSQTTSKQKKTFKTTMKIFPLLLSALFSNSYVPLASSFAGVTRVFVSTPTKSNHRLVKDCMTPNPVTLKTTDTVDEAIAVLLKNSFNGAPVVDPGTLRRVSSAVCWPPRYGISFNCLTAYWN
jgi:hypothetical protein